MAEEGKKLWDSFVELGKRKDAEFRKQVRDATPENQCMVRGCEGDVSEPGSWWCPEHAALRLEMYKRRGGDPPEH